MLVFGIVLMALFRQNPQHELPSTIRIELPTSYGEGVSFDVLVGMQSTSDEPTSSRDTADGVTANSSAGTYNTRHDKSGEQGASGNDTNARWGVVSLLMITAGELECKKAQENLEDAVL